MGVEEGAYGLGRAAGGEYGGGLRVGQDSGQTVGVSRQIGGEQGDGDDAGPERGEEADDVVSALGGEQRDAFPGRHGFGQPGGDRAGPYVEAVPGERT